MTRATSSNPYGLSPTMRANLQRLLDAEARGVGASVDMPWAQADALERRGLVVCFLAFNRYGRWACRLTVEGRTVARWRPADA